MTLCSNFKNRLSDDLEGINQFQVDFEGHIVVVVVRALWANALQGAGILAVAPMDEADVLAVVELGVATGALDFDGFFKSESVAIFREYAGVAHRWVDDYLRLLHHELQRDVVDGLLVHKFRWHPWYRFHLTIGWLSKDDDAKLLLCGERKKERKFRELSFLTYIDNQRLAEV